MSIDRLAKRIRLLPDFAVQKGFLPRAPYATITSDGFQRGWLCIGSFLG